MMPPRKQLSPAEKSARAKRAADLMKARQKRYQDRIRASNQNIGDLPPVANKERRADAENSFRVFCETYFPGVFRLAWSKDHLRVIAKIEAVVLNGETFAVAMPRGSGKSALCRVAVLWAVITGRHPFVKLIGAVSSAGTQAVEWFKDELSKNELLRADFPEVCHPIFLLQGDGRSARGQRYNGEKTNIKWTVDRIVLPTVAGSAVSGAAIDAASLEGNIRGGWLRLPNGTLVRPTLAICDDPQTPESARSQGPNGQTARRLQIINRDVQGLAGPGRPTGIIVPCTVIEPGDLADQLCNRRLFPNYRGERTKRFVSWPTNKALWEEYREVRERSLRSDDALDDATEFYRQRMARCGRKMDAEPKSCPACQYRETCMDCGAQVDWAERTDDPRDLSAVQSAMHSLYKYGPAGFASEFQNEPLTSEYGETLLTAEMCANRFNGRPWAEVPLKCTELTMGVDVQQSSLWYVVCAWEPDFTGYVVDYGVWPRQARAVFTLGDVKDGANNLATKYPGRGVDGAIQAGLEEFVTLSLNRDFKRSGGAGLMRLSRIFVDTGYWATTIAAVKHRVGGSVMLLSKGASYRAGTPPISSKKRKPGERYGDHWRTPNTKGTRDFPYVEIDTNYWKSFVHRGLLTAPGDPGALTLFGDDSGQHLLLASHVTAETWEATSGRWGDVQEWTIRPNKPDNHWFDGFVMAAVAASYQGIVNPSQRAAPQQTGRKRVVMSIAELQARASRGTAT